MLGAGKHTAPAELASEETGQNRRREPLPEKTPNPAEAPTESQRGRAEQHKRAARTLDRRPRSQLQTNKQTNKKRRKMRCEIPADTHGRRSRASANHHRRRSDNRSAPARTTFARKNPPGKPHARVVCRNSKPDAHARTHTNPRRTKPHETRAAGNRRMAAKPQRRRRMRTSGGEQR